MTAYYNEIDPFAAQWLRNLIAAGHIAPGEVDEKDIRDVRPADLAGFRQHHFFAGIGLWSLALRWAGWPDDKPVWTGSCPCQPFSAAGQQAGYDDERHLAPVWLDLVRECRPAAVFGEQVASKAGRNWLAALRAEMEALGYALGAADIGAAGIGAPHIRQRLWFGAERVADSDHARSQGRIERGNSASERASGAAGVAGRLADADGGDAGAEGIQRSREHGQQPQDGGFGGLADAKRHGQHWRGQTGPGGRSEPANGCVGDIRPRPSHVDWRDADWLYCRDEKWRPVEPGTFPLVDGYPQRMGVLRAYGNAICPQVAAGFIEAMQLN